MLSTRELNALKIGWRSLKRLNQDITSTTQVKCNYVTLEKSENSKALDEQVMYCHFKASWKNGQFIMSK